MAYENSGILFRNKDKKSDNHPDYGGKINIGGTEYYLNGWLKLDKNGDRFLSLSVKPKEAPKEQTPMQKVRDMDDDVPF